MLTWCYEKDYILQAIFRMSPVEEFLDSLSGKQAQKIAWVLELIEALNYIPSNYLKNLVNTRGILEVRVQVGKDIFRLLGFQEGMEFVVLT